VSATSFKQLFRGVNKVLDRESVTSFMESSFGPWGLEMRDDGDSWVLKTAKEFLLRLKVTFICYQTLASDWQQFL